MTLDEKLAAIDQTMKELQEEANEKAETDGVEPAPIDPATLTMCEGCQ